MHNRLSFRRIAVITLLSLIILAPSVSLAEDLNPLWKVSSKKGSVYLLGSVHLLKSSDYPLDERIVKALHDSEVAVFEIDLQKAATVEARNMLNAYSSFSDGRTLEGSLSKKTYEKLASILDSRGMDIARAQSLKPWYMANIITVTELQSMGFLPQFGLDMHMYTRALTMGKEIQELETLEYQLGMFNSMSMKDQEAFVLQTMAELDTMKEDFPALVKAWKTGDTEGLEKLLEACKDFRETCHRIIDQRNLHWMPRIEELINSGRPAIIIAGAGHMVGEKGLLNLLKNRGYRVEQL